MSRRKQANPKSIKDDAKLSATANNVEVTEQITTEPNIIENTNQASPIKDELEQAVENTNGDAESDDDEAVNEEEKYEEQQDIDISRRSVTNDEDVNDDGYSQMSVNNSCVDHDEIDVENISENEDEAPSPCSSFRSESTAQPHSPSLSHTSSRSRSRSHSPTSSTSNSTQENQKKNLNANKFNNDSIIINSNQNPNASTAYRSLPIVVNGKKYYPLLFNCPDCGVRYSDKGTLLTHQQNYCSKRSTVASSPTKQQNDETNKPNGVKQSDINNNSMSSDEALSSTPYSPSSQQINTKSQNIESLPLQPTRLAPTSVSSSDKPSKQDFVSLVKTEIYQCNHCLFTTDKKPLMNKHSRVHLPQKRKAMEEFNNVTTNSPTVKIEPILTIEKPLAPQMPQKQLLLPQQLPQLANRNQSYCTECEIQFTSMKTFLHHKTHYCQKYKTIEAIVPAAENTTTQQKPSEVNPIRPQQPPPPPQQQQQQPLAIKQDFVLKNNEPNKPSPPPPHMMPLELKRIGDVVYVPVYMPKNPAINLLRPKQIQTQSETPLDLSRNSDNEQQQQDDEANGPLDLSLKCKVQDRHANVQAEITEAFTCKACKLTFNKQTELKMHKCAPYGTNENLKVLFKCKLCVSQPQFNMQEAYIQHLSEYHSNQTVIIRKAAPLETIEEKRTPSPSSPPPPLPSIRQSQPMVTTTNVKHYYICTTCGYRGNTIRGVKQHGKLHLSNNEPFSIADLTEDELNMRSSNKTVHKPQQQQRLVLNENENDHHNGTIIILSKQQSYSQIPLQQVSASAIINDEIMNNELNKIKRFKFSAPPTSSSNAMNDFDENGSNGSGGHSHSHTHPIGHYCSICDIKFQHEQNFSAHKKFYCKEKV